MEKKVPYVLQFINSARLMASSLSNLVNNFSGGIHRNKCKFGHDDNKCKTCGIKCKYCDCFLQYANFKDDEKLEKQFFNTYKFSNNNNNKFILSLRKGFYLYEYMDDWEKFNETSLPEKEDFYSQLNM